MNKEEEKLMCYQYFRNLLKIVKGISKMVDLTQEKIDKTDKTDTRRLMLLEEELSEYRKQYDAIAEYCNSKLMLMPDQEREMLEQTYINHGSIVKLAQDKNYSEATIRYQMQKSIEQIFQY